MFPFQTLLVVELSSVLAGPAVGMFFAELGAKVIKVENRSTGGDVTRSWKLPQEDSQAPLSAYYHSVNWGKEAHLMDLARESDRAQVLDWLARADVVITNFKAGSATKLGMDYDSLKALNPRMVYGSISAYGHDNPRPGFDAMLQAETGWIFMNGEPAGNPVKLPVALVDVLAAHQLKEGILVALLNREKTGQGTHVTVSLYDTAIASLTNQASNWLNVGALPKRKGSQHPNIAPYGDLMFTADNRPIILGTGTQRQFEALCEAVGLFELSTDTRFASNADRVANRTALIDILLAAFRQLTFDEIWAQAQRLGITLAPINNLEEVFAQPEAQSLILTQTEANGRESKRVKTVVFKLLD